VMGVTDRNGTRSSGHVVMLTVFDRPVKKIIGALSPYFFILDRAICLDYIL
jgi:hypothetical protein